MNGNQVMRRWHAQNSAVNFSAAVALLAFVPPLVFAVWLAIGVNEDSLKWCANLLLIGGAAVGSIMAFVAAGRYAGSPVGRAWASIGVGMALATFAEGAWAFQELVLGQEVSSPAVADIGYLAFYVPIFLGLLMMPQAPLSGLRRAKLGFDLAVATAAIALLSSHFVITDLVEDSSSVGDWIGVAYPVLDIFLVCAALVLIARGGRNVTNMNLGLLALGFAAIGITDSLSSANDYGSGSFINLGWMIAYALIILAGASAAGRTLNVDTFPKNESRAIPIWQSLALNAALVPVGVVLLVSNDSAIAAGFIALVALAFGSHLLTHLEIIRLNSHLVEMADALQLKASTDRVESILRQTKNRPSSEPAPGPELWPPDVVTDRSVL